MFALLMPFLPVVRAGGWLVPTRTPGKRLQSRPVTGAEPVLTDMGNFSILRAADASGRTPPVEAAYHGYSAGIVDGIAG
jgi:hypothetical protein